MGSQENEDMAADAIISGDRDYASEPGNPSPDYTTSPGRNLLSAFLALARLVGRCIYCFFWLIHATFELFFGFVSMVVGLSVLATIPLVQFVSLGYLLDLSARVANTGRISSAFRDLRSWSRYGGIAFAVWVLIIPLRFASDARYSALLLDNPERANSIQFGMIVFNIFLLVHIPFACFRGGRFRHFLWPAPLRLLRQLSSVGPVDTYRQARDGFHDWFHGLEIGRHFLLGAKGFFVAFAWLFIPISIMVIGTRMSDQGLAFLFSLFGATLLAVVLLYVPFLQANFAVDESLSAGFNWRRVRNQFRRAPVAWWFALLITLALAFPLYVLKAELIPREAAWLPSIVFVLSILPARIFVGWAVYRAEKRVDPRHFIFRWSSRLLAIPVVLFYAFVVYLTQYISWYGGFSLYEQHAFLLPVPFVGL